MIQFVLQKLKQNNMKDSLGDRMKASYEDRTRILLPRRTFYIIRIDGKAFHTYAKGCKKPFDDELIFAMDETTKFLCSQIQGAKFGFVQSDEISLVLTDFDDIATNAWFDGNLQKITSISASLATAKFNEIRKQQGIDKLAFFDSRVFTIADREEVKNYMIWRQNDCVRNSISMVAQSLYSHKQLNGVNTSQMQELIFKKGINWNDFPVRQKRGGFIDKISYLKDGAKRNRWDVVEPPTFTQDRKFLNKRLPKYEMVAEDLVV
jgi:tRNA(His) 5'-end guanylyltransferase